MNRKEKAEKMAKKLHGICPYCGKEHGKLEANCDLCDEIVEVEMIQAYHDVKNNKTIDVCEKCGAPEGVKLLKDVIENNDITFGEFKEKYGHRSPWVFNLPDELT